jgi:hypothetical protein
MAEKTSTTLNPSKPSLTLLILTTPSLTNFSTSSLASSHKIIHPSSLPSTSIPTSSLFTKGLYNFSMKTPHQLIKNMFLTSKTTIKLIGLEIIINSFISYHVLEAIRIQQQMKTTHRYVVNKEVNSNL